MNLTFNITNEKVKEKIRKIWDSCESLEALLTTWILELDVDTLIIKE